MGEYQKLSLRRLDKKRKTLPTCQNF